MHTGSKHPTKNALKRERDCYRCAEAYNIEIEYPEGFNLGLWEIPEDDTPEDVNLFNDLGQSVGVLR